jgi:hypothetical protein
MTHTFVNFGQGASKTMLFIQQMGKEFIFFFSLSEKNKVLLVTLKSCIHVLNPPTI